MNTIKTQATPVVNPLRVGIGGPVGSGKTALCEMLCKRMRDDYEMAVITNDIYTKEDMEILLRADALPAERLMGVETGGCPHTAIREDASINLEAIARMSADFPDLDLILVESGGDDQPGTVGSDDLRDRCCRRREDSTQRRPRHYAFGSADHQQDRSGALRGRQSRHHGAGCQAHAGRTSVCVYQLAQRGWSRGGDRIHPQARFAGRKETGLKKHP